MNAITNPIVDCPKCCAIGSFRAFAHIHNGICFLCLGEKRVSKAAAGRWLASQVDAAPVSTKSAAPKAPARPTKTVDMGAWGKVLICRMDDGTFTARDVMAPGDHDFNGYVVYFAVTAGRVAVDGERAQYGMTNHWRAFEKALQGALRA